ncbi:39S ribosomal protein L19, mitochondrial, partial [Stegodyphus mimosarum]
MSLLSNVLMSLNRRILIQKLGKCFSTQSAASVVKKEDSKEAKKSFSELAEYRYVYPEFLPDPAFQHRHKIREKLERQDMLKRRRVMDIPEFYVGSVLAVTASDPYAPGKETKFVGICIARTYNGLRATFVLRNVVDKQGVEIMYDLYNPRILCIEVLKLEKRLDDELYYLRDAAPEFSTFPFDMEPEFRVEGEPVRINPLKVKLKPPPWCKKWEQKNLKGVEDFEVDPVKLRRAKKTFTPWEKYDLMKEYRRCIPEEDQIDIWEDVEAHRQKYPVKRHLWKRTLQKAAPKTTRNS